MSKDNSTPPAPENTTPTPVEPTPAPAEPTPTPAPEPTSAPAEVVPPAPSAASNQKVKTPEDELATKLCIASLICYFGAPVLSSILSSVSDFTSSFNSSSVDDLVSNAMFWPIGLVLALGPLAGIILMIIARVKAPKNTFGKVLMWVYIALFILKILAVIALILLFGALVAACAGLE